MLRSRTCFLPILFVVSMTAGPCLAQSSIIHDELPYSIRSTPVRCGIKSASTKKFTIESRLILNKNFLKNLRDQDAAIEFQLKHLMGFFKNQKEGAALFAYRGPVKILKKQDAPYGMNLKFKNYLPSERGTGQISYVNEALKKGVSKSTDEATEIHYQAELMVSDCSSQGFEKIADIKLPRDPYLSLWLEDAEDHAPKVLGPFNLNKASNCSSPEIAMFGTGDNSWYFWDSSEKSCKLSEKKIVRPFLSQVQVVAQPEKLSKAFFPAKKRLNFYAIFGEITDSEIFLEKNYPELRKKIKEQLEICKHEKLVPKCLTSWDPLLSPSGKRIQEPGTYSFIAFLKMLHSVMAVNSYEIEDSLYEKEMILKITGKLRDSSFPTVVHLYLGRTTLDHGSRASKKYVQFLYDALKSGDSVSYVGHAGLGKNFSISEIQKLWKEEQLTTFKRTDPLWLGLYNCEGVSYFGFDLHNVFKGNFSTIETFTSGKISGPQFPLYHLQALDLIYSGKEIYLKDIFTTKPQSSEFLTETWIQGKTP